ncbi:MAG: hypothetical protein CSB33_02985 [Desulfobacterales bacterium]|nr:MAG: hypothetical protein CSB33_02985 [Desulfobacterales bacterium]
MNFASLSRRDRTALFIGGVVLLVFAIVRLILMPLMENDRRMKRQLAHARDELAEITALAGEYRNLRAAEGEWKQKIAGRPQDFKLLTFINERAGKAGVTIASMKPSVSRPKDRPYRISKVEVKLKGISLVQLTPFLHLLENSDRMVVIRRLSITRKGKAGYVDVVMQVETYMMD